VVSILHVSDVHFGPKHRKELSVAVLDLARRARPTALVVSGDLTQRAKPAQFREAGEWLADLPCPVAFVPGNHDVPLYRVWERLFSPFGVWRRWFDRSLVREVSTADVAVVGINTAHAWTTKHGRVDRAEMEGAAARVATAPAGALRVLVAHHPLAYAPELGTEPVARRGDEAIEACRRAGVELVLSGHVHSGFWFFAAAGERVPGPLVIHAGTSTSSRGRGPERDRCSLNWIEVDSSTVRVERRVWRDDALEFFPESAAEFARGAKVLATPRVS